MVPTTAKMREQIKLFTKAPTDTINNVYKLPSIERAVRYLHGAAGFPTNTTWLKAIRSRTFVAWPLINVKHVNKYFPESEETQKGHMRNLHKNTRSKTRAAKIKSNRSASHNSPEASLLEPPTPQATENTHLNRGDAGVIVQIPKPHESPAFSETT